MNGSGFDNMIENLLVIATCLLMKTPSHRIGFLSFHNAVRAVLTL